MDWLCFDIAGELAYGREFRHVKDCECDYAVYYATPAGEQRRRHSYLDIGTVPVKLIHIYSQIIRVPLHIPKSRALGHHQSGFQTVPSLPPHRLVPLPTECGHDCAYTPASQPTGSQSTH